MEDSKGHYSIEELAELVGLPIRTIRYYISEGLLSGPGTRGKAAIYGEEHLLRLRLIRLLSRQHVPLVEMRDRLIRLSINEISALLAEEEEHVVQLEQAAQAPPAEEYVATLLKKARRARQTSTPSDQSVYAPTTQQRGWGIQKAPPAPPEPAMKPESTSTPVPEPEYWQRWELAPGIELHIRTDSERQHQSLLEKLFRAAGKTYPPSS